MKLLLVGLLATAAQGGSLSRPRRTLPVPDCSMSNLMSLQGQVQSAQAATIMSCGNQVSAGQEGDPDYEFLERRLGDLCQHDCYTAVETITAALADMNCNLQLAFVKQAANTLAMVAVGQLPAGTLDQFNTGIDALIAEGITEVTHDEFQQLHNLTASSCAEIAAPPGQATANTTTCAGEFMALQSSNASMHTAVCGGLDASCVTLASGFANMYNGMANDLCHGDNVDRMPQLCQHHTAQSVIAELSGSCAGGTGPTLSPAQQQADRAINPPNSDSSGPTDSDGGNAGDLLHGPSKDDSDAGGLAWYYVALVVIVSLAALVGGVYGGRNWWRQHQAMAYNPVEMYDFEDKKGDGDEDDDDFDDSMLELGGVGGDIPLGAQSPEATAANARELMD